MKALNYVDPADGPQPRMLGERLFHRLKNIRKFDRTIDETKRSTPISHLREIEFLWGRFQEHLVKKNEDINAHSIELSLKPKTWKKDSKKKLNFPANLTKAAPAKEAAMANVSSKGDAKGKTERCKKRNGKDGKKAKHYPSKRKQRHGIIKLCVWNPMRLKVKFGSDNKPGKAMVIVAIIVSLSSMAMPVEGYLEFIADTVVDRHFVSFQA